MRTPRSLAFAFVAAALVMVLVWFVALYNPQGSRIAELEEELAAAQGEEQSLRATLSRLEAIDADRPALEAELRRLTAAIPPTPELAGFILAAHDAAAEADIDFMSITPAPPVAAEAQQGLAAIALGITAEGRFFSVLDFLHRLEELERALVIDSLNLTRVAPTPPQQPTAAASFSSEGIPLTFGQPTGGAPVDQQLGGDGDTTGGDASAATGVQPRVAAQSLEAALLGQVVEEHTVSIQLQARAFTTAVPPAAEPGPGAPGGDTATTTTTTAPAGANALAVPARRA